MNTAFSVCIIGVLIECIRVAIPFIVYFTSNVPEVPFRLVHIAKVKYASEFASPIGLC